VCWRALYSPFSVGSIPLLPPTPLESSSSPDSVCQFTQRPSWCDTTALLNACVCDGGCVCVCVCWERVDVCSRYVWVCSRVRTKRACRVLESPFDLYSTQLHPHHPHHSRTSTVSRGTHTLSRCRSSQGCFACEECGLKLTLQTYFVFHGLQHIFCKKVIHLVRMACTCPPT
jgi:hypothetical protein